MIQEETVEISGRQSLYSVYGMVSKDKGVMLYEKDNYLHQHSGRVSSVIYCRLFVSFTPYNSNSTDALWLT